MATYTVRCLKGKWNLVKYEGQSRTKTVVGAGPQAEAKAKLYAAQLTEQEQARVLGVATEPITFATYAERWLEKRIKPHQKTRYHEHCRTELDIHLLPRFGKRMLASVTREDVTDLVADKLNGGLAEPTVKNIVRALSALYNFAIDERARTGITENPAARLGRLFTRRRDVKVDRTMVYTDEQLAGLFAAADKYLDDDGALAVKVATLTGVREGELFGLQWGDWNFKDSYVALRRAISYRKGALLVDTPKSGKLRDVEAPDELIALLRKARSVREAQVAVDGGSPSPWLFPSVTDPKKPMNPSVFYRRVWLPLVKHSELHHIPFHGLRHTFATISLAKGAPIEWVSRQLGHSDISITLRWYGHFRPGQYGDVRNLLARAVAAKGDYGQSHNGRGLESSRAIGVPGKA